MFPGRSFRLALAAAALLGLLSACADVRFDGLAPSEPECARNSAGECVLDSEGCSADDISTDATGEFVCATCDGGAVEICGGREVAVCFDQETGTGETCQRCVTERGEVLYDDCALSPDAVADLTCEVVRYESPQDGADAGAAPPAMDESVACEVCRDGAGRVVTEVCRPEADECHEVMIDGRMCTECTQDGAFAYRVCPRDDLDPARCEAYGNDQGRCVDCYADDGALLTHECQVYGDEASGGLCELVAFPDGSACRTCYDETGAVLSETCAPPRDAMRCEQLVYTEQTCVVCVDDTGAAVLTDCRRNDCADDESCPPPPPCEVHYQDDGTLCRLCPVAGSDEPERRCLTGGELYCSYQEVYEEPAEPGAPEPSPSICVVCTDGEDGSVVYESCEGAVATPIVCEPGLDATGVSCEVCYDPSTGEQAYTSCADEPMQCAAEAGIQLLGANGEPLFVPGPSGSEPAPAVADCVACPDGADGSSSEPDRCSLRDPCAISSPDESCPARARLLYHPTQCADPWGPTTSTDDLVALLTFFLDVHEVPIWRATLYPPSPSTPPCEACDCPTGARLKVEAFTKHEAILLEHGFVPADP